MVRFSKILLLSLLVVGLCAPLALATTSRVQALAGAAPYINDDSDIFRWYGTLPSYSKMVMAEAGGYYSVMDEEGGVSTVFGYQALGFTHDWGEDHWLGTWAVFLMRYNIEDPSYFVFNPLATPADGPALGFGIPSTKFAFSWGKDVGQLALGLSFTRSDAMYKPAGGTEVDLNFTTIGGGLRWDINEDVYGDAAITLGFAGGKPGASWDKSSSSAFEGRLFWEFMENATLVPYVGYRMADFSLETTAPPAGDNWNQFTLGASFDFDVNTNNTLIFAAEAQSFDWKYSNAGTDKSEWKQFALPKFYVALESDITSWFTFRVGATKTMVKTTLTAANGDEYEFTFPVVLMESGEVPDPDAIVTIDGMNVYSAEDFTWHLGGGFHVGEWDIDAVFSQELPFRLGYWLTGYGDSNDEPVVGRVSATYRF
jgi:hypothetical protein